MVAPASVDVTFVCSSRHKHRHKTAQSLDFPIIHTTCRLRNTVASLLSFITFPPSHRPICSLTTPSHFGATLSDLTSLRFKHPNATPQPLLRFFLQWRPGEPYTPRVPAFNCQLSHRRGPQEQSIRWVKRSPTSWAYQPSYRRWSSNTYVAQSRPFKWGFVG